MGIDLATWRARIGLNYYHMSRPLQTRWRNCGRLYRPGVSSWGVGEVVNDTPLVLKGCMTVVALSLILQYVVHSWSKLKGKGGGVKVRCHWRETTSQVRGTRDGGGILLLRAVVVVISLLLVMAGDVERNPGPGELSLKALFNELHPVRASWYNIGLELNVPYTTLDSFRELYSDPSSLLCETLLHWLKTAVDPPPTWEAVVTALRLPSVNEKMIAAHLEAKYCNQVQPMMGNKLTLDDPGKVMKEVLDVSAQWYHLGVQLKLRTGTLDNIQAQFPDPKRQLLEMLKTWLTTSDNTSWKTLIAALRSQSVGASQLAGVLEKKYFVVEPTEVDMGGLLRSVPPLPYEGSKPVQKKSQLNIDTLSGEKPQLDIDSSEPTLKALLSELHPVRASWFKIGLELDIPYTELIHFRQMHSNFSDSLCEMLVLWLKTAFDRPPTWEAVVTALRSPAVNENYLADRLESKYCNPVQHVMASPIPVTLKRILRDTKDVTNWFSLGIQLEIELSVLKRIGEDCKSDTEQCKIEVINFWLCNDAKPSWSKLAQAVEDIGGYSKIVLTLRKNQDGEPSGKMPQPRIGDLSGCESDSGYSSGLCLSEKTVGHRFQTERTSLALPAAVTSEGPTMITTRNSDSTTSLTPSEGSQKPPFGCGCGKCTFLNFIESGCPTSIPSASSFPYLNLSGLTHEQQEELRGRLRSESRDIMMRFQELVSATIKSFKRRCVPLDELVSHVMALGAFHPVFKGPQVPVFHDHFKELKAADTISKVFLVLSDYFSFFNYHIIEHIIKELGTEKDKAELQRYKEDFNQYVNRRIFECPPESTRPASDAHYIEMFVILDSQYENYTIEEMNRFGKKLSEFLHLPSQGILHLYPGGSIFHVPESGNPTKKLQLDSGTLTIQNLASELHLVSKWYKFGITLGLKLSQLDRIEEEAHFDVERCRVKVLDAWMRNTPRPSWKLIVDALKEMGEMETAMNIDQKYIHREPGGLLCSVPPLPYEGSKPVQKKSQLNIDTLSGEKPQLDIGSSGM